MKMHHIKDEKSGKLNVAPESLFCFPVVLPDFGNTFAKINGMSSHLRQETHKMWKLYFIKEEGGGNHIPAWEINPGYDCVSSLITILPPILKKLKTFLL